MTTRAPAMAAIAGTTNVPPVRCRRFRLLDAMILIIAAAVWANWMRESLGLWSVIQKHHAATRRPIGSDEVYRWYGLTAWNVVALLLPVSTVAYTVLRLIPPRPSPATLIRQPGVFLVAYLLAYVGIAWTASFLVEPPSWMPWVGLGGLLLTTIALTARRWFRIESGWIETIGRGLVVGWLVAMFASLVMIPFRFG